MVRHWFDLGTDIATVDRHLASSDIFAPQVRARPGIRVTRYPQAFEAAILIVLGQQVSLAAGRTFGGRLVAAYGEGDGPLRTFPRPERLAAEPTELLRATLGITGARARTLQALATHFADGFASEPGVPIEAADLLALPGVGPWTVSCLALRSAGEPDVFPAADAVLRRALEDASAREAADLSLPWAPYRSYATVRLWAMATAGP
ncbi:MAG: DNA-3-methyladenine glycosylase 2 family protein [Solirubrobacterales bacterium]|nr:DNA-3-methyladenine glycosylase 2 family protein [Solirubrobacterales bacterium]